jgi:hypothetical protein
MCNDLQDEPIFKSTEVKLVMQDLPIHQVSDRVSLQTNENG